MNYVGWLEEFHPDHLPPQTKKHTTAHHSGQESSCQPEPVVILSLYIHTLAMSPNIPKSYKNKNDIPVTMELETGAGVSIISEQTWSCRQVKETAWLPLHSCSLKLQSYPSKPLDVLGSCTVKVTVHDSTASLLLAVVKGDGILLLGRNWHKTRLEGNYKN